MTHNLTELRELLREGQRRSQQGSYRRRWPAPAAVFFLQQAAQGLRTIVQERPADREAWRLLSQAEEALLDYRNARIALEKVLALQPGADRSDLKKLALLREYEAWWGGLRLTPVQLTQLGSHLEITLRRVACDRTLHHTLIWLEHRGLPEPHEVVQALEDRNGYCDCMVVRNVVR
jgi:tetratricopeptide (TPR) repeat protein